jgi:S1-C subfamily serine protease
MKLSDLDDDRRSGLGLDESSMALHADHVGQYGEHAVAKRAGMVIGDVILSFDGLNHRMTESELLAHVLQRRERGDDVELVVLRNDGTRVTRSIRLP